MRIITALVLIPLTLWVTVHDRRLFAALCALVMLAGAWEWSRLAGLRRAGSRLLFLLLTAALLVLCQALLEQERLAPIFSPAVAGVALAWWAAVLCLLWRQQGGGEFAPPPAGWLAVGVIVLVPAWTSLVALRENGPGLVLCLFVLIWTADTGAFYVGKKWGRRKLASRISPNKTWEGLGGGLVLGLAVGALAFTLLPAPSYRLGPFLSACLATLVLSAAGDLLESMLKRQCGVKDSGVLAPGHGGALDRIDSLTAAAPAFFAGAWLLEKTA